MFQFDPTTLLVFVIVFLLLWLVFQWRENLPPYPLPPSPPYALPLLGHLFLMSKDPQEKFKAWRKQYGDIFSLKLGSHVMIIISSYQLLKEAFVKHGDVFSHRPSMFVMDHIGKQRGVILSSGEKWKEQRKAALEILREFGLGKNILAQKIQEEVIEYLKGLEREDGASFNPNTLTHHSVANIICSITFGRRYEHGDQSFLKCMAALESNMRDSGGDTTILNFLPFLRFLPGDLFHLRRVDRNAKLIDAFCKDHYTEHMESYDETSVKDFIGAYIREMKKKEAEGKETTLNEENLLQTIGDLFAAGMETTATTLRWAIIYFLHYPRVQEKCYQEIGSQVGTGRLPTVQDKLRLPYVEATAMEILRKSNIVPFGVFHTVSENVVFKDYFIPQNAIIMPLMESVLSDEQIWADPEDFRPERFLDDDGKCVRPDEFIPFSLGRRVCLGESLARMELFLFLSAMIQKFVFLPPEDGVLPSLQGILGITLCPQPFRVRAVKRKLD